MRQTVADPGRFRRRSRPASAQVPAAWRPWLLDPGSLTARLVARSAGAFRVEVLAQGWAPPSADERRALGLGIRERALIREVLLRGGDQPWVYARSVLPLALLRGRYRFLSHLGTRPLGALLFRDRALRRGPIEVALRPVPALPGVDRAAGARAWLRRSLFDLGGRPLLVAEMFLPGFEP